MPYKMNSAGKMQPYDEKGRFARVEANIIKQDIKPLKDYKEKTKIIPNVIKNEYHIETDEEKTKKLKNKINRVNKSDGIISNETILDNYNCGTKESQELVERVFDRNDFTITATNGVSSTDIWGTNCDFNPNALDLNNIYDTNGRCFYHEMGHALDTYGIKSYNGNKIPLLASNTIKLSNGKTLSETLKQEAFDNMLDHKFEQMEKDYNNREKELWMQYGYDRDKANKLLDSTTDKIQNNNKLTQKEKIELIEKRFDENKKLGEISKIKETIKSQLNKEYSDLDDIRTSYGEKHLGIIETNHDKNYWGDNSIKRGQEFFAECFSAKATNPRSWELLNKYFPKSCKAFNELLKKFKSKEI